jgi:hypothetical protein
MKPLNVMFAVSFGSWFATLGLAGQRTAVEVLLGMLGPLLVTAATWVLVERTCRRDPARLTPLMLSAFAAKMLFFGAYVAIVLRILGVRPVPFVVSFTGYFIALYALEALYLRRLFIQYGPSGPSGPSGQSGNYGQHGQHGQYGETAEPGGYAGRGDR